MFALFALLPFISNITCKFNSCIPCLVSVTPLYFCTHLIDCAFFFRHVSWRCLRLGDTFSWRRFLLGDAFSWRRLLLGDAFSWRRLLLGDAFAASNGKRVKTKNKARFFSNLLFSFIRVTSLKNPRKGKRVFPSTRSLHGCLHKSTKIKLQVGCIPATRDGTPLQGL